MIADSLQLVHTSFYNYFEKTTAGTVYTINNKCQLQVVTTGETLYVVSSSLGTVNAFNANRLGPLASLLTCNVIGSNLSCVDGDGVSVWQTNAGGQLMLANSINPGYSTVNLVVQKTS